MTTEVVVQPRVERLFEHLREQIEIATRMGGNVQLLVDVKLCEGRLVGEAVVDLKHRFDLQAKS